MSPAQQIGQLNTVAPRPRVTGTHEMPLKTAQPEVRRKCFVNTPHLIDTEPTGALAETLNIY